ncbi:DUF461 domain-containing protein [Streptomyces sp. SID2888]|uniref:DUF461 domain-containing protein n=1 Tax=Streptomyces sp. SID2888 TaxID=2690256 RepID=UPI00136811DE|nr:DUF461 domain-containing protein [Streptomyces sp. SID2888]
MSSSLRRGALAAAAVFSIASLAACGAGNHSQTLEIHPDNAATSVGDLKIQNAIVITQPGAKATGPAVISATVFNSGRTAQTLDAISVEGAGNADLSSAKGGPVTVPAQGSVVIGGKDNASAVLNNATSLQDGNAQKVTFTFSKAGGVSLRAFVVPAESYFSTWGPSSIPSPAATATESAAETTEPSDAATESATASESSSAGH